MKIQSVTVFNGKNIYSHKPVIRLVLDIEDLHDKTTKDFEGFSETLVGLFPTLEEHYCGLGYRGGFVERLKEGTYFGHVLEHLILELQSLVGYQVFYGKTRLKEEPSVYNVVFEFENQIVAMECVKNAIKVIRGIINNEEIDKSNLLSQLDKFKSANELGPSTQAIFNEAKKRGIPVTRLGSDSVIQLGYGKYSRLVQAAMTDTTSCISADISCNKQLTKQLLEENDIPVPYGGIAYTDEEAAEIAEEIGFPIVLKPLDGNQGKGVVLNLNTKEDVKEAFKIPSSISNSVLVEKFVYGNDYRVLVIGDKVSGVSERRPPSVTGDGAHTIRELVEIENRNVLRGDDHEKPLTKIKLDNVIENFLKNIGLSTSYIPEKDEVIWLRDNANLSTGGTARECTAKIHSDNARIAVNAAKAIGLDIAGVDIKAEDISKSIRESQGAVIEVNAAPGLRMHLHPSEGNKIDVASDILDFLFPTGTPHSIPIVSLTGTNGKTTTARLIKHTLSLMGNTVGMTSTSGVYIGDQCLLKGDNTGPFSARAVLKNKSVDIAVLEVARGGIVKRGLGYDLADVALITNISNDHLGLDGVETLEDLAFVKSLVVESIKPEGYSVLNADDSMVEYLVKRANGNIVLFSRKYNNPMISRHIKNGGTAVYVKSDMIIINDNAEEHPLVDIKDLPITFKGFLDCNIENSLAASSALYSLGVPLDSIRTGLMSFKPDINMNPGRFNIFDVGNFKVMLDYGHNIGGFEEIGKFVPKLGASRVVGVIGLPGDRSDADISSIGSLCSNIFSNVYIKEDKDLRGREPGQVAKILQDSMLANNYSSYNIKIILSELEALQTAMNEAEKNDMIILFYEEYGPALRLINEMQRKLLESKEIELNASGSNVIMMPLPINQKEVKVSEEPKKVLSKV